MTKEPKRNVYVGHRYVPKIMGEWEKTETYEGLSIVTHQGASYTSKKRVPKGIDILDKEYWAITGNYDAQVDYYRDEVRQFQDGLDEVAGDITQLETDLTDNMNGLRADVTQDLSDLENTVDSKLDYIEGSLTNDLIDFENNIQNNLDEFSTNLSNLDTVLKENSNYEEISYLKKYDNTIHTMVYVVHIPFKDTQGKEIHFEREMLLGQEKNVLEYARENNTSLAINAGMFGSSNSKQDFSTILNGEIISGNSQPRENRQHLAIMEDGTLKNYPTLNTSMQDMVNDGVKHSTVGFTPIYENGGYRSDLYKIYDEFKEKHPRQIIAQSSNKDYYVLTIGGRGLDGEGATIEEVGSIIEKYVPNLTFAYQLDGGGSNTTVIGDTLINPLYNTSNAVMGNSLRNRPDVLYIKKTNTEKTNRDSNINTLNKLIGNLSDITRFISGVPFGNWKPQLGSSNEYVHDEIVYDKQEGSYVRLGNLVVVFYHLKITDKGGLSMEDLRLRGLPGSSGFNGVTTSPITRITGLARDDFYNPYLEHGSSGSANLMIYNEEGKPSSLRFNALSNTFELLGTHIYMLDELKD